MYNHYLFNVIKFNNSCNSNDEKGNTKIKYMCKLEHKFFNIQLCNILNIINHCGKSGIGQGSQVGQDSTSVGCSNQHGGAQLMANVQWRSVVVVGRVGGLGFGLGVVPFQTPAMT